MTTLLAYVDKGDGAVYLAADRQYTTTTHKKVFGQTKIVHVRSDVYVAICGTTSALPHLTASALPDVSRVRGGGVTLSARDDLKWVAEYVRDIRPVDPDSQLLVITPYGAYDVEFTPRVSDAPRETPLVEDDVYPDIVRIDEGVLSAGSGGDFAHGALQAYVTRSDGPPIVQRIKDAMRIACNCDSMTGGTVDVVRLDLAGHVPAPTPPKALIR